MDRTGSLSLLLALAAALGLVSCGAPKAAPGDGSAAVYKLRAEVVQLPAGDNLLTLHHEAIDGYRDQDGKVTGMDAMTMPFPVSKSLSLAGVHPGDRVEVTLRVDWKADPGVEITALQPLPPGAPPLVFREARLAP